jgi:lauroyl/myristoyl acyltransferase
MDLATFSRAFAKLENQAREMDLADPAAPNRKSFLFFRANYRYLFGEVSEEEIQRKYRAYWLNKQRNELDFHIDLDHHFRNHEVRGWTRVSRLAEEQALIFSSFHFGPYNVIGLLLSRLGVQFSVLANGAVNMEQIRAHSIAKYQSGDPNVRDAVLEESDVIKPGDMGTLLRCLHKLRSGRHLLVYGDGLEGQTSYFDRHKLVQAELLGRKIYARRGVASLAYKLKVPIVPVICRRDASGRLQTRFYPALNPHRYRNAKSFIRAYCEIGYRHLEPYVQRQPEAWEIFDHLQMYLPQGTPPAARPGGAPSPEVLRFDTNRFGIFRDQERNYLLDSDLRTVFGLSRGLSGLLPRLNPVEYGVLSEVLPASLITDLLARGVLVAADQPKPEAHVR